MVRQKSLGKTLMYTEGGEHSDVVTQAKEKGQTEIDRQTKLLICILEGRPVMVYTVADCRNTQTFVAHRKTRVRPVGSHE